MEKALEPKLDLLLAQKVKPQAMRKKETAFKKERNVKYGQISNVSRKQSKRPDPKFQDHPVENDSTLFRFAKQKFGVELSIDSSEDVKPASKPSGKSSSSFRGSSSRRGNTKILDCYSMDIAPMNIFENQCIPVGIHNLSKSFRPNLITIGVLSLGTKFIPKWNTTKTSNTFKRFYEFKN